MQHKGNFGAVQANTIDTAPQHLFVLRAQARIKHNFDALTAFQLSRTINIAFRQTAEFVLFANKTLIFLNQDRFRIDQQLAAIAVHHQRSPVKDRRLNVGPHHRRDP